MSEKEVEYRGHKIRQDSRGRWECYTLLTPNSSSPYPTAPTLKLLKSIVDMKLKNS